MFDHLPEDFRCPECGLGTEIIEYDHREVRHEMYEDTDRIDIEAISVTEWECRNCDTTGEYEVLLGIDRALGT